jgi:hypothetical protein
VKGSSPSADQSRLLIEISDTTTKCGINFIRPECSPDVHTVLYFQASGKTLPVLEQQAREGNTEALAKGAQNPAANLIILPIQRNSTPSNQWAPRAVDPDAEANRTLNV